MYPTLGPIFVVYPTLWSELLIYTFMRYIIIPINFLYFYELYDQQQHVSFNDKSPKADNLRRGWMRGFQAFLREQQLVVALESVGSKTMNRKMKSTLQGEFDGIPSRRDQPNKWAQHIQPQPAIRLEIHSSEDPRK